MMTLTPPDDSEKLTDHVLYEWSCLGLHLDEVHRWASEGGEEQTRERVEYLLEVTEPAIGIGDLNCLAVREWRSMARMFLNLLDGGSVPRSVDF